MKPFVFHKLFFCFFAAAAVLLAGVPQNAAALQYKNEIFSAVPLTEKTGSAEGDSIIIGPEQLANKGSISFTENTPFAPILEDTGTLSWDFAVKQKGVYVIFLRYLPLGDSLSDIEAGIALDDEPLPGGVTYISLTREFTQEKVFSRDSQGNDIQPKSKSSDNWREAAVFDPAGYINEPIKITLSSGTHSICLTGMRGSAAVESIRFEPYVPLSSYAEVRATYPVSENASRVLEIEAETPLFKSSVTIAPSSDRTSAVTSPQSAGALRLNCIGGNSWKLPGQWITWSVDIPETGLYKIASRFLQNTVDGMFVSRRLYIDGNHPFAEAAAIRFPYKDSWQCVPFGSGETEFEFYLTKGTHTLTLEAVLGDVGELLGEIENSLTALNQIYRDILLLTGPRPDVYRDYNFIETLPEALTALKMQKQALNGIIEKIAKVSSSGSSYISLMKKMLYQIEQITENPDKKIPVLLSSFKGNLGSLGTWLNDARSQPLLLDRIYLYSGEAQPPKSGNGFFSELLFQVKCFLSSFVQNYDTFGQTDNEDYTGSLTVWVPTSRDQAQIIRRLSDDEFSPAHKSRVILQLVSSGNLLPSVLAGNAPDVALTNSYTDPMNYAVRNALLPLSDFPDFKNVTNSFHPEALIPYTYENVTYALPETMTFPMFFYRKDIFKQLKLEPPETWDDFLSLIPVLQSQNMNIGIPPSLFYILLYQNGGRLYTDSGRKTALTEDAALSAFKDYTELFSIYQLPVTFDFANRFRTGEMPCGIQDYTVYNQLTVFAPEIKGLWSFIKVPGILREDGNVEHISVAGGSAAFAMSSAKNPILAWEYLKWWMSAETQSRYGVEMESILGAAAKQPTANMEALKRMGWSHSEYTNILSQFSGIRANPEVPGGYYTDRIINFAFKKAYSTMGDPLEILQDYFSELNAELLRKNNEFHRFETQEGKQ